MGAPLAHHADLTRSGAFVARFELPPSGSGPLDGLSFAVKDLIDVAGWTTSCGNPSWRNSHPPAAVHAVCVEQLLQLGARCVGKTVSDELAFSLLGQNHSRFTSPGWWPSPCLTAMRALAAVTIRMV
ncbi:amidase family protein [Synechococcus sp. CS-1328]|uniref:amidase family protein n=1 Tax=Synechococcus sp. CS-1328 TaxID=2847976 RepID=UPI00223ADBDB|nr:amidase family protein [Synechococcus sp. CS-1328]MCT0224762.1 hypothetical protein [Synechococcus sp. CS-1328]